MKRIKAYTGKLLTVFLVILALLICTVHSVATQDVWPMFRHDLEHTGRSPYVGPMTAVGNQLMCARWKCQLGDEVVFCSPTIAPNGTIYIGDNDGKIYAVNPEGWIEWSYEVGGIVYSSPTIGPDGTIYVGTSWESGPCSGAVYAIYSNGELIWRYPNPDSGPEYILNIASSPAIDTVYDAIYIGGSCMNPWGGILYAINLNDGTLKYEFEPDPTNGSAWMPASPAIREDGMIIIGDYSNPKGVIWAINPADFSVYDKIAVGGDIRSSAAIDSDRDRIYFGNSEDTGCNLWAYDYNLEKVWEFPTGDHVPGSPAIGSDGTIYIGSYDNNLYAINPGGTEKWHYATGGRIFSSPAIDANNTVYVGSLDHKVYAINSDGTLKWRYDTEGAVYSSPAIGNDGAIYVGSTDGHLHAIGNVSGGSIPFGEVEVGSFTDRGFVITNDTESDIDGYVREYSDHYNILYGGGYYHLEPDEYSTVIVRFQPLYSGVLKCVIWTGKEDVICSGIGKEKVTQSDKRSIFLDQNKPNPFNPVTEIRYDLPLKCKVKLEIYNVLGQRVITLVDGYRNAGSNVVRWEGKNENGIDVSSGIYFYRLRASNHIETKKMVVLR